MFKLNNIKYKNIINIKELNIDKTVACILGQSGSGKSTVLKMLNKIISPDEGTIIFNGEDIANIPSNILRSKAAMLPQTPVIYDGNVRDNLLIGLMFQNKPLLKDEQLIKLLSDLKLNKKLDDDASFLSGGEKQRLCIARLLLIDADVYLLDEPSSALDKGTEDFVIDYVVDFIRKNNKSLIMVTHSPDIAKKYADQIIVIKGGKVSHE